MKYFFTLISSLLISVCAFCQPAVPQLAAFGKDSQANIYETSAEGYRLTWTTYSYCTYNVCFNNTVRMQVYDSNGAPGVSFIWEKPYVSSSITPSKIWILDATVDKDMNLIIVGTYRCKINFSPNDPAPTYFSGDSTWSNSGNVFIAKYRLSDGHFLWQKSMQTGDTSSFNYPLFGFGSLTTDKDRNIYLFASRVNGAIDIDPGSAQVIYPATVNFLAKYNSSGIYQASVAADGISYMYYKSLRMNNDNLYMIGAVDSAGTGRQTYLLKQYDLNTLSTVKSKKFGLFSVDAGSSGRNRVIDLAFAKNNVWVLGDAVSNVTINTPANNVNVTGMPYGMHAYYVMKMDNNWELADARLLQRTRNATACPVKMGIDSLDNLMIAGSMSDSINADLLGGTQWLKVSTSTYYASSAIYLLYYNSNLALQWAKTIGDTSYLYLIGATFGTNRNVYLNGVFKNSINFSFTGTPSPNSAFLNYTNFYARYKWNTAGNGNLSTSLLPTLPANKCNVYPNPSSGDIFIKLSKAYQGTEPVRVFMYDCSGRIVYKNSYPANAKDQITISAPQIPHGTYFLELMGSGGMKETHTILRL